MKNNTMFLMDLFLESLLKMSYLIIWINHKLKLLLSTLSIIQDFKPIMRLFLLINNPNHYRPNLNNKSKPKLPNLNSRQFPNKTRFKLKPVPLNKPKLRAKRKSLKKKTPTPSNTFRLQTKTQSSFLSRRKLRLRPKM